jgi:2-polyprenyl-3-methyl-5-hydroxy-6-metoxy-1,4-benzoquinol methylase
MIHLYQLINYKAKKFWDSKKEYIGVDLNHHGSNPYIGEYMRKDRKINFTGIIKKYFDENGKCRLKLLSIACGAGKLERSLLTTGFFSEIHGCDISTDSINVAKEKAQEIDKDRIITYFIHDANSDDLKYKYDVIIASSCTHHIERLEFFYENVKKALKPNGIFMQAEYVGASRFQHSVLTIGAVNFLLALLPQRLKKENKYKRIGIQQVLSDPSEAVRSDEIIPLTKKYFPKTKIWKFSGIMIHLLYQCVKADEFHTNKKRSLKLCLLVFNTEKLLNLLHLVKKDNAILVSKAKA